MKYRKEIDGLRAIAVLSVIFYHAGFGFAGSGYAGVDVFFVISGYLIGGQIFEELKSGCFSFREFYQRRARRILPALYLVIVVSIFVGMFTMVPHDYRYFGGAALSTLFFASNVWFMNQIDYFNPQASEDPLVHTWSLGIEEQFYIVVPLVLVFLWRHFRIRLTGVLWTALLVSFIAASILNVNHSESSFYLLHTRAWELLSGVLVAWHMRSARAGIPTAANWYSATGAFLGFALLLAGVSLVPHSSAWPGAWTLLPISGAVLLLLLGGQVTPIHRILSAGPVRFVGLISYSAYLWHQPVFSFLELSGRLPREMPGLLLLIGAVLGLSAVSWRFVELPFRRRSLPVFWSRAALTVAALFIAAFAVGGHFTKGYPARLPTEILQILAYSKSFGPNYERCVRSRVHVPDWRTEDACVHGEHLPAKVALWGDSHAARLADPLGEGLDGKGLSMVEFTLTSCQPIPGLINFGQTRAPRCPEFNDRVLQYLLQSAEIETVVLFATWDNYFSRSGLPDLFGYTSADNSFYSYPVASTASILEELRRTAIADALRRLLNDLTSAGKSVVVVASLPRPDVRIPEYVARSAWHGDGLPANAGYPREFFDEQTRLSRKILATAAQSIPGVAIVYPEDYSCDDNECFFVKNGHVLFSDGNHPTLEGSALIVPPILRAIRRCGTCGEQGMVRYHE